MYAFSDTHGISWASWVPWTPGDTRWTHPGHPGHSYASGALASANLLKNNMGKEQIETLIKIKREKGMISLCGLKEGQTEADFSKQGLGAEDATLIGLDIEDNGALSDLDISNNNLTRGKWTNAFGDGDRNDNRNYDTDMGGVTALAEALKK